MKIKFKKFHKDAVIPLLATKGAACRDVVATEIIQQDSYKVTVHLGFGTEIPEGYKMCIAPRSSFTQKGWIMANSPAQIDSDFTGEWKLKFEAIITDAIPSQGGMLVDLLPESFPYKVGDRVAQIWLEKIENFEFEEVKELSTTDRDPSGFGSTGN